MPDRDKVLKGLECCTQYYVDCQNCPYKSYQKVGSCCCSVLMIEAKEILKNKEVVKDEM